MEAGMRNQDFLVSKVKKHDVIVARVISSPEPQVLKAIVVEILSTQKGIDLSALGREIDFVCSPGTWGDAQLSIGDEAIIFISLISNRLYEDAWRGHMLIEDIEGEKYAIYPHRELWLNEEIPSLIRENSKQDPKRPFATAIHFVAMEKYLKELIEIHG
ncbi:hypothetical protein [Delftia acidovorans]|uniref:hypothetical protein n=2 Tax=Delftia acidovorans TaxID=80866 RepID=UPI0012DAAAAC|nr:hypothetical protein [Delftia acidovorans]